MLKRFCSPGARRGLCMLLALPAAFSFTYLLRTDQNFTMINHSVVSILLWWACWQVMERAAMRLNRRAACVCVPLGFVFSLMMVAGSLVMQYQTARLHELKTWVGVLCATPLLSAACVLAVEAFPKAPALRWPWMEKRLSRLSKRAFFLLCWGLIFAAWLPALIASYPGLYGYDSIYQIDYYLKGAISTHHPILHTWWLGLCVITLGEWLGSPEAGMCVYSVMQMLLLSGAMASILGFLRRHGGSAVMQLACLLGFMFVPIHPIMGFSATKDVAFSAFIVWTLIWLLESALCPQRLQSPKRWAGLLGLGFGLMVFRNQGVYVFAFALLTGLCVMPGMRKRLLLALLSALVAFGVWQGPVSTLLKADRVETVQEMLSVPLVQLSCARVYHANAIAPEDQALIEAYIPQWNYYDYTSCGISDPVKNTFNAPLFREDPLAFVRLWARVGRACPLGYADAFLRLTAGAWYPDVKHRDWASHHPYFEYHNTNLEGWFLIERRTPAGLQWLADFYADWADNNSYQKIPVLSMLFSGGLAAWVMLWFIAWAVCQKAWRMLWPAALLFGLWGTVLLGPVVILRYVYALMLAVPLLLTAARAYKGEKLST